MAPRSQYAIAHHRYAQARAQVFAQVLPKIQPRFPDARLLNITPPTLDTYRMQWTDHLRHPQTRHFRWHDIVAQRNADPAQFQLALWNCPDGQQSLHALGIGRTSSTKRAVRLEYLESCPFQQNPFAGSVIGIYIAALEAWGVYLGAKSAELIEAHEAIKNTYERVYGYTLESQTGNYYNLSKALR